MTQWCVCRCLLNQVMFQLSSVHVGNRTRKVFKVELRAKKQRLEELTQACNQYGFILEDLHERKSLRFKALQDIQEEGFRGGVASFSCRFSSEASILLAP